MGVFKKSNGTIKAAKKGDLIKIGALVKNGKIDTSSRDSQGDSDNGSLAGSVP